MAKQEKKPLVNWLKRKKEVSFRDSTTADGKTLKVTEKKVTAPDSKLSKGFEKKKVTVPEKRKTITGMMAGTAAGMALMATPKSPTGSSLAALAGGVIADRVVEKVFKNKNKVVLKTKTKKK